jgi:hypothetical protein
MWEYIATGEIRSNAAAGTAELESKLKISRKDAKFKYGARRAPSGRAGSQAYPTSRYAIIAFDLDRRRRAMVI